MAKTEKVSIPALDTSVCTEKKGKHTSRKGKESETQINIDNAIT